MPRWTRTRAPSSTGCGESAGRGSGEEFALSRSGSVATYSGWDVTKAAAVKAYLGRKRGGGRGEDGVVRGSGSEIQALWGQRLRVFAEPHHLAYECFFPPTFSAPRKIFGAFYFCCFPSSNHRRTSCGVNVRVNGVCRQRNLGKVERCRSSI